MEILNSQVLWEGYDPTAEQLETNVFKTVEKDGLVTTHLYFTGRTVSVDQKSRVYAVVCYKNTNPVKNAVLLVDDYKKPVNLDELEQLARAGFVAMAIDFAGTADSGMYTVYPQSLQYCNAVNAHDLFEITTTAKETKLYEYALNCRRAITYLATLDKVKGISLLTMGRGTFVGAIVMGVEDRLERGAVLFGSLNCKYPEDGSIQDEDMDTDDVESLNRHLEYDIRRQAWTLGLAPQTYALQIKIPLYVINSANSNYVDIEQVNKNNARLNRNCRFLILPNAIDYLTDKYFDGLVRWFKGAQVPLQQTLFSATDANGEYGIKVQTSGSINKTSVWYCSNPKGKAKYWCSAKLVRDGSYYLAKPDLFEKQNSIIAFCIADREVPTSTPLFYDKATVVRPKIVNKNIFAGNGTQTLIRMDKIGRKLNVPLEQELREGYLGILGANGKALATFAISDTTLCKNAALTLGLDICCSVKQKLTVLAVCKFGSSHVEKFSQTFNLDGAGKWQRITIERENFRRVDDGKQIADDDNIDVIIMSADSEFLANNIFLV
ncbi:MAG: hypothetical protein K2M64_04030 [Clostridia bacterium]|nr:hypothetical protein [Clostridia bacterium]